MDMLASVTPPDVGFLGGSSLSNSIWLSSSLHKRSLKHQESLDSPLAKPLISETSIEEDKYNDKPSSHSHPPPLHTFPSSRKTSAHSGLLPSKQCSCAQAVVNGVNVLCGVGILTTPYAVKEGGWLGLLVLIAFGLISCYTGILLKKCLDSNSGLQTYPDIGQAAFGMVGRLSISIILYAELYVACVEYILLMSDNLSSLFPNANMNFGRVYLDSHQLFAVTTTIIILPTVWLRNLSLLSYISAGGVISSILVVICLLWLGVVDHVGFHPSGTVLDLANLPVAMGLYGFCYSGHAVFPNIYTSMKKPTQFPAVLKLSFAICCFLFTGVAISGFLMFGGSIKSQFTLNMPHQFLASKIAVWTTVVNPLTKYALTITPVALSLEELLPSARLKSHSISVLIRTALVISTLVVALTIPFFGFLMALMGSFLTMLVALIFPCICYLRIAHGRASLLDVAGCVMTITIGLMCACIGTYSAIERIADKMV